LTERLHRIGACALIGLLLGPATGAGAERETELQIDVQNMRGEPVADLRAELLLSAWGDARKVALPVHGARVRLPFTPQWLRAQWPGRAHDVDEAFLYLSGAGVAALRSEPFLWIGARADHSDRLIEEVQIRFPRNSAVTVKAGERAELRLSLRDGGARALRFVDDAGAPVVGVSLRASMFWSNRNHCGYLAGADLLAEAVSDEEGRVRLPDGDFPYALEIEKRGFVLASQPSFGVQTWITRLTEAETPVRLHQLEQRALRLRVRRGGKPAGGEALQAVAARCGCGACSGYVAESDERGEITLEDFFPEELERVFFEDRGGVRLWEGDPRALPRDGVLEVELPARVH
jgi:hypothetical protein